MSLHYKSDSSYLFFSKKIIYNFETDKNNINFPTQLYLEHISKKFVAAESREEFLKENVHNFSVNYNAIDKSDILNIHKYSMVKNKIK